MKKIFIFILTMLMAGAGCGGTDRITNSESRTSNIVTSGTEDTTTLVTETKVGEAEVLAYLLLTAGSKVTVSRGDEQTDGVNEMELYANDTVEVLSGEARLLFAEYGVSVLPVGTKVTIMPEYDGESTGLKARLILEAGEIWTRLEKLLGTEESFSIEANDVVATVRGTAFGVRLEGGEVNVQVAQSKVEVAKNTVLNSGRTLSSAVVLSAGNGLNLRPAEMDKLTDTRAVMLKAIKKLDTVDKNKPFYKFVERRLGIEDIKRPVKPFKWSAPIFIDQRIKDRLSPLQIKMLEAIRARQLELRPELTIQEKIQRDELLRSTSTFALPIREILRVETVATGTPSLLGPK